MFFSLTVWGDFRIANFERLEGQFKQRKTLAELGLELETEGHFAVRRLKEGRFLIHWNIEKPRPSQICLDQSGVTVRRGTGDSAKTSKVQFAELSKETGYQIGSLLQLMALDQKKIEEQYDIEPKPGRSFRLKPKDPKAVPFENAELRVNAQALVDRISIFEKANDKMEIQFLKLKSLSHSKNESEACL